MTPNLISVALFSNELSLGGAEQHILTLLRGLDRSCFRLHLICAPELAAQINEMVPADVTLIPLELRRVTQLSAATRLGNVLKRRRVDILHSHLFYASLFASPIGKLCGVPVVVETPHLREAWRRGWKACYAIDRVVGHFVDYYIAVSSANAEYLIREKRIPASKVTVIHNGCNVCRFHPAHSAPVLLKTSLGIGHHDPVLMIVARLEIQKGHGVLFEALKIVRRDYPRLHLICVGEGSIREELEAQVLALGLKGWVHFVGFQSAVADWLALGDVIVLPSLWEGLPIVALEALAAAKAVVATSVDGTPEVVIHEETGMTVPPGDRFQLARAIRQLIGDPDLRSRLGHRGRDLVLKHFTEEAQVRKTQELYCRSYERARRTAAPSGRLHPLGDENCETAASRV
jgi:glycosyltransferase involved in cell wall biosynthesis